MLVLVAVYSCTVVGFFATAVAGTFSVAVADVVGGRFPCSAIVWCIWSRVMKKQNGAPKKRN